jgi:hypothetical protein
MRHHPFAGAAALAVGVLLAGPPVSARAEDPPPVHRLADASAVIGPEADVRVTDTAGHSFRGRLVRLTDTSLQIKTRDGPVTFEEARIRKVEAYRTDSVLNGLLIGAGVGAGSVLALAYGIDRNEADEYGGVVAFYGAIGGAIGAGIDALIRGKHTVLVAEPRAPKVSIQPMVTPQAQGLRVAVTF